jgi:hypothetical protein
VQIVRERAAHDAETDDPDNAFVLCRHDYLLMLAVAQKA